MTPKQIYERIRVNYRDAFQFISFGIHRYAKCSSSRNKNGLPLVLQSETKSTRTLNIS